MHSYRYFSCVIRVGAYEHTFPACLPWVRIQAHRVISALGLNSWTAVPCAQCQKWKLGQTWMGSEEGPVSLKQGIISEMTSGLAPACHLFIRQVGQERESICRMGSASMRCCLVTWPMSSFGDSYPWERNYQTWGRILNPDGCFQITHQKGCPPHIPSTICLASLPTPVSITRIIQLSFFT